MIDSFLLAKQKSGSAGLNRSDYVLLLTKVAECASAVFNK